MRRQKARDCPKEKEMSRMTNYPATRTVSHHPRCSSCVSDVVSSEPCEFITRLIVFIIKDVLSSVCKHLQSCNGVNFTYFYFLFTFYFYFSRILAGKCVCRCYRFDTVTQRLCNTEVLMYIKSSHAALSGLQHGCK